jgi:hypothetical protein
MAGRISSWSAMVRRVLDKNMPDPDDTQRTDTLNQYNGEYSGGDTPGKTERLR